MNSWSTKNGRKRGKAIQGWRNRFCCEKGLFFVAGHLSDRRSVSLLEEQEKRKSELRQRGREKTIRIMIQEIGTIFFRSWSLRVVSCSLISLMCSTGEQKAVSFFHSRVSYEVTLLLPFVQSFVQLVSADQEREKWGEKRERVTHSRVKVSLFRKVHSPWERNRGKEGESRKQSPFHHITSSTWSSSSSLSSWRQWKREESDENTSHSNAAGSEQEERERQLWVRQKDTHMCSVFPVVVPLLSCCCCCAHFDSLWCCFGKREREKKVSQTKCPPNYGD